MDTCRKCKRLIGSKERKWFNPEDPGDIWTCEECHQEPIRGATIEDGNKIRKLMDRLGFVENLLREAREGIDGDWADDHQELIQTIDAVLRHISEGEKHA